MKLQRKQSQHPDLENSINIHIAMIEGLPELCVSAAIDDEYTHVEIVLSPISDINKAPVRPMFDDMLMVSEKLAYKSPIQITVPQPMTVKQQLEYIRREQEKLERQKERVLAGLDVDL